METFCLDEPSFILDSDNPLITLHAHTPRAYRKVPPSGYFPPYLSDHVKETYPITRIAISLRTGTALWKTRGKIFITISSFKGIILIKINSICQFVITRNAHKNGIQLFIAELHDSAVIQQPAPHHLVFLITWKWTQWLYNQAFLFPIGPLYTPARLARNHSTPAPNKKQLGKI